MFEDFGSDASVTINPCAELTAEVIEEAAVAALANFGTPQKLYPHLMLGTAQIRAFMSSFSYHPNPEFIGLEWSSLARLTKRERRFAHLHFFLYKFKIIKKLSEEDNKDITEIAIKRLRRAKWAQYQQKKSEV